MLTRTKHRGERRTTWAAGRDIALLEPRIVVSDSFNRANNSTSLGAADTGQVWTNVSNSLGIFSNQAGASAVTNNIATLDTGTADGTARVTLALVSGGMRINVRASDVNNRVLFGPDGSGNLALQKVVAGAVTTLFTLVKTPSSGDVLTLKYTGSTYTGYLNGTIVGEASDPFNATVTKAGLQCSDATGRFDNFQVLK